MLTGCLKINIVSSSADPVINDLTPRPGHCFMLGDSWDGLTNMHPLPGYQSSDFTMKIFKAPPYSWVVATTLLAVLGIVGAGASMSMTGDNFVFTLPLYNGTIYENTFGKVYIQTPQRMGIFIGHPSSIDMEYAIVEGDPSNVFKAETQTVKDFCFLRIRTQTTNYGALNRELNSVFHLKVRARGTYPGDVSLETTADVVVTVLDQNEFSPLFSNLPHEVTIPEDMPIFSSVYQVKASDADIGVNGEIYYRLDKETYMFAVHPTTGVVSLTRPLKHDSKPTYELDIVAEDRGGSTSGRGGSPNKAKLTVNVSPVNLSPPTIKVQNHQSLVEQGNLGAVFAVVTITDEDRTSKEALSDVTIANDTRNIFRLVPQNANGMYNIIVASPIDRETLPANYNISVSVYYIEISEAVPVNTPLLFVRATDKDLGSNGDVRYSIVDGNKKGIFQIDTVSGLIRTSGDLDAEVDPRLTLVVQAQDQANSGTRLTGQARVIVSLTDYNDNSPDFNMPHESVTVLENLPKGSRVTTVRASDEDSGDNGRLSYSLVNFRSVPFEINSFTGEVTTKEVLDYETMRRSYQLHIRVSDWGVPYKREEEMVLNVRVVDANDNSPEFVNNKCTGYLSKESPLKMDVVNLTALDLDLGNAVTYSITEGNEDDCFSIVPTTGTIVVNCDMSGYREETRVLQVVASDDQHVSIPAVVELTLVHSKRNPNLSVADVRVSCQTTDARARLEQQVRLSQMANADDAPVVLNKSSKPKNNPPVILNHSPSYVEVSESATAGTEIFDFAQTVTDYDHGYDGQLKYVISSGDDFRGSFKLDTFTGKLTVLSALDFETKSEYSLTLSAIDFGQPPESVFREIRVLVRDENDYRPLFDKTSYSKQITENAPVNTSVIQVKATDLDSGVNAEIRYSIMSDDSDFYIDPVEGIIKVKRPLDRERSPSQVLTVQAQDLGVQRKLASIATVSIAIGDINDNIPVFHPESYLVRLREDLPVGTMVTTLTAIDPDEGDNGRVTYSFAHGMDSNFDVDPDTGTIRIHRQVDYERKQVYRITGVARDNGQPSLTSTCLINIEVMDVNENLHAPVFPDFVAKCSVYENQPVGSYVMNVLATDMDDPASGVGQLFYTIQEGTGLGRFTIDINDTSDVSNVRLKLHAVTKPALLIHLVNWVRAILRHLGGGILGGNFQFWSSRCPFNNSESTRPVLVTWDEDRKEREKNFLSRRQKLKEKTRHLLCFVKCDSFPLLIAENFLPSHSLAPDLSRYSALIVGPLFGNKKTGPKIDTSQYVFFPVSHENGVKVTQRQFDVFVKTCDMYFTRS
ncbi:hypothetical protein Btru_068367 [Bulinus truncatus]|nr:hypothetical protein Btru_068367 [Bulinus truncatus]